jgi:transcription elongation factor Elf1
MGATQFVCTGKGVNVASAFVDAKKQVMAENDSKHSPGTITEKTKYKVIECNTDDTSIETEIDALLSDVYSWIQDKWGPAGAIQIGEEEWVFFGYADN